MNLAGVRLRLLDHGKNNTQTDPGEADSDCGSEAFRAGRNFHIVSSFTGCTIMERVNGPFRDSTMK